MKNVNPATQMQPPLCGNWPENNKSSSEQNNQIILISLMAPFFMVILNLTMFGIALPTIRDSFHIQADVAAWTITAYMIPFMVAMPLYGRLGDALSKRQLFLAGIMAFVVGSVLVLSATHLSLLLLGRAIQGFGSAGVSPLGMAMISQIFPAAERGKALGTWQSIGPITGMAGPFLAGLLVDHFSWRTIFAPILLAALAAIVIVRGNVPDQRGKTQPDIFRTFDWTGAILLTLTVTVLMFYLSSRIITGVPALRDWRLFLIGLCIFAGFIVWERKHKNPYVALDIFGNSNFSRASVCSGIRMFSMSAIGFLVPLYLTDIHHLSAFITGVALTLHAAALLVTMRKGGQLADRWNSRWPVTSGLMVQVAVMVLLFLLPATAPLWSVMLIIVTHGLGAGLSLAALHRASLSKVPQEETGAAAGLYSMIRFCGMVLGPTLGGVLLQLGLDQSLLPITAYQTVFGFVAAVAALGVVIGWGLRE